MHSLYYICELSAIDENAAAFGQLTYMPTDSTFSGPFMPDTEMVVCSLSQYPDALASSPDILALPDPLRNRTIQAEAAAKLASYGVTSSATTFDVVDILTERSKGFAFVIK